MGITNSDRDNMTLMNYVLGNSSVLVISKTINSHLS